MHYQEVAPGARLLPYVNCYWALHSTVALHLQDRTFPDGCQEIVFNVSGLVKRSDNGKDFFCNPPVELIGQMTRPYEIVTEGNQLYFGVKFYPHSFAAFTQESIDYLRDQSIDVRLLFCAEFLEVYERIIEKRDFNFFVSETDNYLNKRLSMGRSTSRAYSIVDQVVRNIYITRSEEYLQKMHRHLGVSQRHLQNIFKSFVGLSPKQLFRMIRFQSCFKGLHSAPSLTEHALACGYYDQAHFNHDFKALAGITPTAWKETQAPLNRFFIEESSRAYLCDYKN